MTQPGDQLAFDKAVIAAVKSYRYLRVTIIALALGLFVTIGMDAWQFDHRVRDTISQYYYSPAQPFFVAALVGIGICLFCLRMQDDMDAVPHHAVHAHLREGAFVVRGCLLRRPGIYPDGRSREYPQIA